MKKCTFKEFINDPVSLRRDVRAAMKNNFDAYLTRDMTVYDVGCGDKPFAEFLHNKCKRYIGVDIEDGFYDASHIDLIGSAYAVPVENGAADAVISCQVIEHLKTPREALAEANRILAAGGLLFLSFPFLYPLHAAPHDFYRYSEYGAKELLEKHGFALLKIEGQGGFWYCMAIFFGIYIGPFDRGAIKKFKIHKAVNLIGKSLLYALHGLEGLLYKRLRKDGAAMRRDWMTNYVLVAKKTEDLR